MRAIPAVTVAVLLAALAAPGLAQPADPTGAGVTIAVLDTGVDSSHPALAGRVERQSFAEPSTPLPIPGLDLPVAEDPDGQGTAVASLAAGAGDLGLAPGARVLDLQVSAKYAGSPLVDPATEAAAIEAMDALLQDPGRARVVVLSFAQDGVSEAGGRTLAQQARGLRDAGVVVIVPTGPAANPLASAPHVLTVAGSACPPAMGPSLKPDLAAPSDGLQVATPGNGATPGGEGTRSGTALAAAQAAGAAALLFEAKPELPVDAALAFLRDTATDAGAPGPDACTGFGTLNATAAVAWASMWRDPLAQSASRDAPGAGLALLGIGLAGAAWAGRRRA